jgi:hypothetical protein
MDKIIIKDDFLSNDEHIFLKKVCDNFYPTSIPEENKHYFKQTLEDHSNLIDFLEKSKLELLNFKQSDNDMLSIGEVWINKVTDKTNINDKTHKDVDELTSVTFLNENFEGGFLEINQNTIITPKKGRTIFFEGSKLLHRVLPVTSGERFTLVVFWIWKQKRISTIL